ncbi:MAG: hypothetical protein QNJ16_15250, partial [Rhodobacter sp.]|nr:hypothetical protein [Rhodobacter sp.]
MFALTSFQDVLCGLVINGKCGGFRRFARYVSISHADVRALEPAALDVSIRIGGKICLTKVKEPLRHRSVMR